MAGPINYLINQELPSDKYMQGVKEKLEMNSIMKGLQEADLAKRDFSQLMNKEDATARDIERFIGSHPSYSGLVKSRYEKLNESQRENEFKNLAMIDTALEGGRTDLAISMLNDQKESAKNSGLNTEVESISELISAIGKDPNAARIITKSSLLAADPDKYYDNLSKISDMDFRILEFNRKIKDASKDMGEKQSKKLRDIKKELIKDKSYEKSRTAFEASRTVTDLLNSNNPISANAIRIQLPRLLGEVGNLTEAEQSAFGGSKAIEIRLNQFIETLKTGQLDPENKKYLLELVKVLKKSASDNGNDRISNIIDSEVAIGDVSKNKLESIFEPLRFHNYVTDTGSNLVSDETSENIVKESDIEVPGEVIIDGYKVRIKGE